MLMAQDVGWVATEVDNERKAWAATAFFLLEEFVIDPLRERAYTHCNGQTSRSTASAHAHDLGSGPDRFAVTGSCTSSMARGGKAHHGIWEPDTSCLSG
jgi:hypothetical protein